MMKKSAAQGFTLIELIVVIVLIGILAGVAIPRFMDQVTNARLAALSGIEGALNSAVALAQAEYRAEGNGSSSTATSINLDGATVTVAPSTGIPVATTGGIGTALKISNFSVDYGTGTAVTYGFTPAIVDCNVIFTAGTGVVTVTSSGC
jgi:MSHA pilin protein MshA